MGQQQQPARVSPRVGYHQVLKGRDQTFEDVSFAKRRDTRRAKNKASKAARRKNR
jgi:hypothetical protein